MERDAVQLTTRDLYRLRHVRLLAQRAALRAQYAQQQLQELTLELERRYGLLAKEAVLDVQTGIITASPTATNDAKEEVTRGPADHANQDPA